MTSVIPAKAGIHTQALRLRADSKTKSFKKLYRSRAPVIEGVFAEAKQWHGLRRAWRRGLSKMRVQCLLIAAVLNFKRLAAVLLHVLAQIIGYIMPINARRRILRDFFHGMTAPPMDPSKLCAL